MFAQSSVLITLLLIATMHQVSTMSQALNTISFASTNNLMRQVLLLLTYDG